MLPKPDDNQMPFYGKGPNFAVGFCFLLVAFVLTLTGQ
jgi:hypothetical protein